MQMQKECMGVHFIILRGLKKLSMPAMLAFAELSLKKDGQLDMVRPDNGLATEARGGLTWRKNSKIDKRGSEWKHSEPFCLQTESSLACCFFPLF